MNVDKILVSLDPEYRKCECCNRHIHSYKNSQYQLKMITMFYNSSICPMCSFKHRDRNMKITVEEIEEIYGNVYDIVWIGVNFTLKEKQI